MLYYQVRCAGLISFKNYRLYIFIYRKLFDSSQGRHQILKKNREVF